MVKKILLLSLYLMVTVSFFAKAADSEETHVAPVTNEGKRWRIGFYEGGEYIDYQHEFAATIRALMDFGWVEPKTLPEQSGEATESLWRWLVNETNSEYVEFVEDAHYSASWDDEKRSETVDIIFERLNTKKDIDLMLAFGTWAGKDLAAGKHQTPTLVLSASDPLASGIIKSLEDSGFEHVHATIDPYRFERQLKVFHELVGFKRLGVAYEDSELGRSYAAIEFVEKVSQEKGFEVVRCYTKSDVSDKKIAEGSVIDCFESLANQADAIYVTNQGGVTMDSIPSLVKIVNEQKIPTFSQSGAEEVKYGFLFSLSRSGFRYLAENNARNIAKVLNGTAPGNISLVFEEPLKIAINLKSAEIVGFNPPLLLLGAADEIYKNIPNPE
ncbi:MAG: ABC transporter substrate binding protein [Amphritea sp.]